MDHAVYFGKPMLKHIPFLLAALLYLSNSLSAQYLYGVSAQGQGFRVLNLATSQETVLISSARSSAYIGQSTSDKNHRFFYVLDGQSASGAPDTLVTIDITNNTLSKDTVPSQTLLFPEYHNNKIYAFGKSGVVSYDITTHQITVLSTAVQFSTQTVQAIRRAGFNPVTNQYMFLKGNMFLSDTLISCHVITGALVTDTINVRNVSIDFCARDTSLYMVNASVQKNFICHYNLTTKVYTPLLQIYIPNGIINGIATTDSATKSYFFMMYGPGGSTKDDIVWHSEVSKQTQKINVPRNSFQSLEYFSKFPAPAVVKDVAEDLHIFSLYPNPAEASLKIALDNLSVMSITICSIDGRVLKRQITMPTKLYDMDVSFLPRGSYLLSVTIGAKTQTHTFSKT